MTHVVEAVDQVSLITGTPPVVVGGLAVMCRLSTAHRATVDLDIVDRRRAGEIPQLELLRAVDGARKVEPSAVVVATRFGEVKIDVLEVNQAEIDIPSDDPGDRLHATSHAWANDTATEMTIEARPRDLEPIQVRALVAEPGPLVAMKLQAIMNRTNDKEGTDLLDIVRLTFDAATRGEVISQFAECDTAIARDVALHVGRYFGSHRQWSLTRIHDAGGTDMNLEDLDLIGDLLSDACSRRE